jgi:hypothetical protein
MAYRNFSSEASLAPAIVSAPRHDHANVPARFGALEWSVVALAERDHPSSLGSPGRLAVALGAVFGVRRRSPALADPRLEALRRMAVLSWHRGDTVASAETEAFLAAGFTLAQHTLLRASIAAARHRRKRA